jgi:Organic Anion Transporter Polypeptide (OATP) family
LNQFYIFLIVVCINKFIGGTEGATNFLMGLRCVEERDKAVSLGLTSAIVKFCAVIPSPIVFGYIFDQSCLLWGKTCSKTGNCWLYDNDLIKFTFNLTAGVFILIGTCWDIGTWYYSKDVKIFDDKKVQE